MEVAEFAAPLAPLPVTRRPTVHASAHYGYQSAASRHALCEERTRTFELARALAAETIKLKRTLSDPLNQAGLANHLDSVP